MAARVGFAVLACVSALVMAREYEQLMDVKTALTTEIQLGIDLGTTQSVAAVCVQGQVSVIQVDGEPTTPSTVWFDKGRGIEVGRRAVEARRKDPGNVIYAAKRVIGVEFNSPDRNQATQGLPFNFTPVADHGPWSGNVGFRLPNDRVVSPEQIGAFVLKKLKRAAETSPQVDWVRRTFGFTFKSLTVTVPVTFDEEQKRATIRACRMAGFKQVRLVEEPIAAAIAFGLGKQKETKRVLVYDFGGGTLDVAMLFYNAYSGSFYIEATAGERQLGGEDFDAALLRLALRQVDDGNLSDLVLSSPDLYRILMVESEHAKRNLSSVLETSMCIPSSIENHCAKRVTVSREMFELAAGELLERSVRPVDQVFKDSGLDVNIPLDVVLVGGSSRIPAVRSAVAKHLPNSTVYFDGVDPDQAIAIGAAKSWGCNQ